MANKEHLAILEKGVDVWNQWREENPDIKPDLSGEQLISRNLRGVNFSLSNLEGCYFYKTGLSFSNLRGSDSGAIEKLYATYFDNTNL